MDPKRIVIVGGGTAGWLAALVLGEAARRARFPVDLTVVESSKVPSIGVGEGTTAVFRGLLQQLEIDEFEFLRKTDATIKYGIRHRDWRRVGDSYDGPIDDPHLVSEGPENTLACWIDQYCVSAGRSVAEPHLFTHLMARERSPFLTGPGKSPLAVGPFQHAYHFDQARVGAFLREKADKVQQIDALVAGSVRDRETGNIKCLIMEDGTRMDVDFVLDCTGFRRSIIGTEMGADWVSYSDDLPVNRAMPFWLDHAEGAEIPPYTLAWAQKAGWMWMIPTQGRMGCGYVYSDAHLGPDAAKEEIEAVLGVRIEPRADIEIQAGRLDKAWIGNCLALGLAQSFFEPLEATAIHGTIVQLLLFSRGLKAAIETPRRVRAAYNAAVARQGDDFRDFINLHYMSERNDTTFWRDVAAEVIRPEVRARVAQWRERLPRRDDFEAFPGGLPHVEQQLYYPVLDGLGLLDRSAAKAEMAADGRLRGHARKTVDRLVREYRKAAGRATGHRAFLEAVARGDE